MLNISFYLREPQAERATPIIMRLVLQGEKLKYSTRRRYIRCSNAYRDHQHTMESRPPTLQDIKLAMDRRVNHYLGSLLRSYEIIEGSLGEEKTGKSDDC